eukprot:XP_011662806.1 PREDICTED: sushi, nidogen and EGF-like domain-containing protein 1 [Strongylocentrotus purpuratus]
MTLSGEQKLLHMLEGSVEKILVTEDDKEILKNSSAPSSKRPHHRCQKPDQPAHPSRILAAQAHIRRELSPAPLSACYRHQYFDGYANEVFIPYLEKQQQVEDNGYVDFSFAEIRPLRSTVDISEFGDIFFRTSDKGTDNTTYSQAERAIRDATPEFLGHSLITIVVASWIDVPSFAPETNLRNTFQVLIGTDGEMTYVIFNYKRIEWRNFRATAGIATIDNRDRSTNRVSLDLDDLVSGSNYGEQGSWLFEVSETVREIGKGLLVIINCFSS